MRLILKSAMLWRFIGGFALGGIGVLTLHPAGAQVAPQTHAATTIQQVQR